MQPINLKYPSDKKHVMKLSTVYPSYSFIIYLRFVLRSRYRISNTSYYFHYTTICNLPFDGALNSTTNHERVLIVKRLVSRLWPIHSKNPATNALTL